MSEYDNQQEPWSNQQGQQPSDPLYDQPTQPQPTRVQTPPIPGYGANAPIDPLGAQIPGNAGSPKRGGAVKSAIVGLAGGVVGSLAVTAALNFANSAGKAAGVDLPTTDGSGATEISQPLTITPEGESTTVSEAVAAKCLPSVVSVNVSSSQGVGMGSGVILDAEGNIITNAHVVEGADQISVTIGGITYEATLVGADDSSDIAVVKADLEGATVTPIEIGDSDALVVGDWVMTIGSPYGLDQSVSAGIVSALSRTTTLQGTSGTRIYGDLIQVDANINSGNSGGALVNDQGQLVGINTLFESSSGAFAGIGFSISGNYAVSIANKIIAGEAVTHAYIGLSMATVTPQNSNGLPVDEGAYVVEAVADGPSAQAGIQTGDIVVKIDDTKITSADDVIVAVRGYNEGDVVTVVVNRDGEELSFEVTLGNDEQLQIQQQLTQQNQQEQYQQYYNQQQSPYDEYYQQFFNELFGFGR
jgi:putative serine protease PepD